MGGGWKEGGRKGGNRWFKLLNLPIFRCQAVNTQDVFHTSAASFLTVFFYFSLFPFRSGMRGRELCIVLRIPPHSPSAPTTTALMFRIPAFADTGFLPAGRCYCVASTRRASRLLRGRNVHCADEENMRQISAAGPSCTVCISRAACLRGRFSGESCVCLCVRVCSCKYGR